MVNPRSKLRDRIREATEEAILDAAEQQFAADGLHGAKVERIAAQAGVSVGTLYNYFEDRDGLFRALIDTRRREFIESLDAALESAAGKPFREKLLAMLEALYGHAEDHRKFFEILILGEHEKLPRGPVRGSPRQTIKEAFERLELLVAEGVQEGAVRPEMAELAPVLLLGAARGVLVRELHAKKGDMKSRAPEVVRFFLEGAGSR